MTQTRIGDDETTTHGGRSGKSYDHMVGFGEAMLRLSAPIGQRLETAPALSTHVGGAELNGLIAATAFGMPSTWVSAVGDDLVGERIIRHARAHEVTPVVQVIDYARSGLYFVEMAPYPRSTRVSYDRKGSAASLLDQGSIDWGPLITQHTCFYSTGITAAISESARRSLEEGIQYAHSIGAVVAFDINYRRRLWSPAEAVDWMMGVLPDIDVLSVSRADLEPLGQSTDDLVAAREALGVDTLVVSTKERTVEAITVTVCAIGDDGSSEATGEAAVIDAFGAGDAMFGAFLAAAPNECLKTAVDQALKASLITYGIHGDAMDADPREALEGGRILR
jgi:2-dehydro-3-deoxygluconokinase